MTNITAHSLSKWLAAIGAYGCLALLAWPNSAQAADASQNLLIGGAQFSRTSQFAYLGTILPIDGGTLGHGLFISPFLSRSQYTFSQNGTEFTGTQPSASLGVGYSWSTKQLSVSLSVAGGYSNTTLSPYSPPNAFRGAQWFAEPELYTQLALPAGSSFTFDGGYLTGLRSFFVTTYLQVPVGDAISIGPEADFGGGINYRNHTFALRVSDQLTKRLAVNLSAGATTNVPGNYHPYVGVGFSLPFR